MNQIVVAYPAETALHVGFDNLNIHKPKKDRWLNAVIIGLTRQEKPMIIPPD